MACRSSEVQGLRTRRAMETVQEKALPIAAVRTAGAMRRDYIGAR